MTHLTIVGGIHGAGKSTLCHELHAAAPEFRYLTNQEIQRTADTPLSRPQIHALLRQHVDRCFATGTPFLFEHVMSGRFVDTLLAGAQTHGFTTHLVYLDLPDPATSLARVEARITTGGHDVDRDQIATRLRQSRHNFWTRYRPKATTWLLYDASTPSRTVTAAGVGSRIQILDPDTFTTFQHRLQLELAPPPR